MEFEFTQILYAFLLTLFAGFSTSIGAVIAFFSKKDDFRLLSVGLGFSAGVMIYISFMEILPNYTLGLDKSKRNAIISMLSGCGEVWYRAWFGTKRPRVRIPTLRP